MGGDLPVDVLQLQPRGNRFPFRPLLECCFKKTCLRVAHAIALRMLLRRVDGRYYASVQLRDVGPLFGPTFLDTLSRRYMIIASRPASVVLAPRP